MEYTNYVCENWFFSENWAYLSWQFEWEKWWFLPWCFRVTCQQTNEMIRWQTTRDHFPQGTHGIVHIFCMFTELVGGFNPSEKYESQLGWWHSQYLMEKNPNVPNHQPVLHVYWSVVGIQTLPWPELDDFRLSAAARGAHFSMWVEVASKPMVYPSKSI